jgi:hypothetical protein
MSIRSTFWEQWLRWTSAGSRVRKAGLVSGFRLFLSSTMIRAQCYGVPFIFIPAFSDETTRARAL